MIRLARAECRATIVRARMPFRYGIATMTHMPHVFVVVNAVVDGVESRGTAADSLPPKWFTKDPDSSYVDDLADMAVVIERACTTGVDIGGSPTFFAWWKQLYDAEATSLLTSFGVSLVERAMLDAVCRARDMTFAEAVHDLGFDVPPLSAPLRSIEVRHTVGLADPLTDDEIDERLGDGLPESLQACIAHYGLRRLKIKLGGDIESDLHRLRAIAAIAPYLPFTLDGNEQYDSIADFRMLWDEVRADPVLRDWLRQLSFVEQPIHRDRSLTPDVAESLAAWADSPPIIIDESDAVIGDLDRALDCGYVGTSHKNCKGVVKSLLNAGKLRAPGRIHSAEDLTNIGPVALQQDLAVVATLGITHAERNGHHYFAGLRGWPEATQQCVVTHHADLYASDATVAIKDGRLSVGTVVDAPFGSQCGDVALSLPPLAEVLESFS